MLYTKFKYSKLGIYYVPGTIVVVYLLLQNYELARPFPILNIMDQLIWFSKKKNVHAILRKRELTSKLRLNSKIEELKKGVFHILSSIFTKPDGLIQWIEQFTFMVSF